MYAMCIEVEVVKDTEVVSRIKNLIPSDLQIEGWII